jgi:hypothetical protein
MIRKTQFLRYYSESTPEANRVRTERLAERETLLHRLGTEFNRERSHSHYKKRSRNKKLTIFGTSNN